MKDLKKETIEKVKAGKEVTFEELKPLFRPQGVQNGVMKVDPDKCTSCGLCIKNCPFKCWEMGDDDIPKLKDGYACFSCSNCMVACPVNAISIASTYKVEGGYYDTGYPPYKMLQEPTDAKGKPADWTEVERTIVNRRSVRNFKDDPVPEPLIRRILEAGRFAPSAGNMQPWKFTVVTDKKFIAELEEVAYNINAGLYNLYINDDTAMQAFSIVGGTLPTYMFDYRVMIGGFRSVVQRELPIFLNAPCVIFLGSSDKLVGPDLHIGICGQNMTLAAESLGLGCCWSNFGGSVNNAPEIKAKLGFDDQWRIVTSLCIGYPKFKQAGIVSRMFRPVTWFRSGSNKPQIEE
jgi:nitroreductase/NAD-dependent dihydropyrimidine dehydrogenase PreA subunit